MNVGVQKEEKTMKGRATATTQQKFRNAATRGATAEEDCAQKNPMGGSANREKGLQASQNVRCYNN